MKKETTLPKTNYQTLITLGIIFTGAGVAIGTPPMMMLGLIFLAFGLINRDKWLSEKNQEI